MTKPIHGKVQGLKASQLRRLERLHARAAGALTVFTPELARALTEAAADTGRMVGVLCDRRGAVDEVVLGEPTRLYLPDIGRLRAGPSRLRGLRLVVAKPHVKSAARAALTVDHDLITDLERLKLDAVALIEALDDGLPGRAALATLRAEATDAEDGRGEVRHHVQAVAHAHELTVDFKALVDDLERELTARTENARSAAKVAGERDVAVLVGVHVNTTVKDARGRRRPKTTRAEAEASMNELAELARTAGVRVADTVLQFRPELDGRTIVGKGKLEELSLLALHRGADLIIFDRDLSPSQLQHITDQLDVRVLDRTMLILDIFARRAQSRGGKMQVELAQLRYSLPRLAERQTGLSRLTGGIGGQGPGETRLEIDRRRAKEKIQRLEKELERYAGEREMRRRPRNEREVPVLALVGYTNAGKSTLLNRLTGASVYAANELFATLDPTSRRLRFPEEREVILTDTVGFIRDLPETLRNAFRATLEELREADLFLHVVDAADPRRNEHIDAVLQVLKDLDLLDTPRLLVLNKADTARPSDAEIARLAGVPVSALSGAGLDTLITAMRDALFSDSKPFGPPVHGARGGMLRVSGTR